MYRLLLLIPLFLASCSSSRYSQFTFNGHQCFPRVGDCIRATIDGHEVVRLKEKSILKRYAGVTHYLDDVEWHVPSPVSGEAKERITAHAGTEGWFGSVRGIELEFLELGDQVIETEKELQSDDSVRIGGNASVKEADVFYGDTFPPGDYLFFFKLIGTENWDRKTIFVRVR